MDYYEIHDRVLDPYGKKMFDYDTRYSQHFLSREINRLFGIIGNDLIVRGSEVLDYSADISSFSVTINPSQYIHDQIFFILPETTTINFQLYERININGVDTSNNWFRIEGDYRSAFPQFTSFAVENSSGNDDINWVVHHTEYISGNTVIYVASNISNSTVNGRIVRRCVDDINNDQARLICYTKFQYLKTPDTKTNKMNLCLDYIDLNGEAFNGWNASQNRILLGVFDIQRNTDNTEIIPSSFKLWDSLDYIASSGEHNIYIINSKKYKAFNTMTIAENIDGGQI